jgi:hypothetical protein
MGFMVGVSAHYVLNLHSQQKLEISDDIFYFSGLSYVLLSNMNYCEIIDIKVSFELMDYQKRDKKTSPSVWIKHVETVSISNVPARVSEKTEPSKTYIAIPTKLLDCWRKEGADDHSVLVVRATSVHSVTNFRAITNAARFTNLAAFDLAQASQSTCVAREPTA